MFAAKMIELDEKLLISMNELTMVNTKISPH